MPRQIGPADQGLTLLQSAQTSCAAHRTSYPFYRWDKNKWSVKVTANVHVKHMCSCTATLSYAFMVCCLIWRSEHFTVHRKIFRVVWAMRKGNPSALVIPGEDIWLRNFGLYTISNNKGKADQVRLCTTRRGISHIDARECSRKRQPRAMCRPAAYKK